MYWATLFTYIRSLAIFLFGFILFALLLSVLILGESSFNPYEVATTQTHAYVVPYNTTLFNGTIVESNTTIYNTTTTYGDNCSGHSCGWWLNRLILLLESIALALFVLAIATSTWGIGVEGSMGVRESVGYRGLAVSTPGTSLVIALICTVLGLFTIFVAVLISIYVQTGKHYWTFIASVIILAVFALLAAIILFSILFRNEQAIAVQSVYAQVPVNTYVSNNNNNNPNDMDIQGGTTQYEAGSDNVPMDTFVRRLSNSILRRASGGSPVVGYSPLSRRPVTGRQSPMAPR